jgi:hypothetical protein
MVYLDAETKLFKSDRGQYTAIYADSALVDVG